MKLADEDCIDLNSRRLFLKKAIYSSPVLTALGELLTPTVSNAETSIPDPPFGAAAPSRNNSTDERNDPFASQFDK
jgi:hypothetical protein